MTDIKTQSPLAFAAFETWLEEKITIEGYYGVELYCDPSGALHITWEVVTERERTDVSFPLPDQYLTEWLDLQGVRVSITYIPKYSNFECRVHIEKEAGAIVISLIPSRSDAFSTAITKAFSIIDSRLKGEKKI